MQFPNAWLKKCLGNEEVLGWMSQYVDDWNGSCDKTGATLLHWAVCDESNDGVHFLANLRSVNVNAVDHGLRTPLCFAADEDIAEILVKKGADMNWVSDDGSPLACACSDGLIELAKWYVAHGADPDLATMVDNDQNDSLGNNDEEEQSGNGSRNSPDKVMRRRPLYLACNGGHIDIVKWLVQELHVKVYVDDVCAAVSDDAELVLWMISELRLDPTKAGLDGKCALEIIVTQVSDMTKYVQLIAETAYDRGRLLCCAVEDGDLGPIKVLVKQLHANVEAVSNEGLTPFLIACRSRSVDIVVWLVEQAHADVTVCSPDGLSAVFIACHNERPATVKYLCDELHLDADAKRPDGASVLFAACEHGNLDTAQWAVDTHNADLFQTGPKGWTCLQIASSNEHHEVAKWLAETQHKHQLTTSGSKRPRCE